MAFHMYQVGQIILYILHAGLGLLTGKLNPCFVIWAVFCDAVCLFMSIPSDSKKRQQSYATLSIRASSTRESIIRSYNLV
jgi:hypothetical protein